MYNVIIEKKKKNSTEFKYIDSFISQNKPNMGDIEINDRIQWHTQNLLP